MGGLCDDVALLHRMSPAHDVVATAKDSIGGNGVVSPVHGQTTQHHQRDVERLPSKWLVISIIVDGR